MLVAGEDAKLLADDDKRRHDAHLTTSVQSQEYLNMEAKANGNVSFWYADIGGVPAYRPPLPGDIEADVCIVGAGYTGLWTAYYLKKAEPKLNIVIVEKEFAGFGASGRNGGWLSGGSPGRAKNT